LLPSTVINKNIPERCSKVLAVEGQFNFIESLRTIYLIINELREVENSTKAKSFSLDPSLGQKESASSSIRLPTVPAVQD
jgi:hypothetical protein